jgi:hypothetical protein
MRGKIYRVHLTAEEKKRLEEIVRRAFRRTCCFSKKLFKHWKAFNTAFFYINYGFV